MNKSEKFWDKLSLNFDKRTRKYEQNYIRAIQNTRKYLKPSHAVLDYGCGTGKVSLEIAADVKKVHASDISSGMLEQAKQKAQERKITNITFEHTNLFDEIYSKESFDVITAFNILHLFEDHQEIIQRIHDLLVPGGFFISTTVCIGEKKTLLSIVMSLLIKWGLIPYMRFFKMHELKDSIAQEGFQIIETEQLHNNPSNYFIVAKKI